MSDPIVVDAVTAKRPLPAPVARAAALESSDVDLLPAEVRYATALALLTQKATSREGAEAALAELSRAVFLNKTDPRFYAAKARAHLLLADVRSALACARHVQQLSAVTGKPRQFDGQLGQLLDIAAVDCLNAKDFEGAVDAASEAVRCLPLHPAPYTHRAVALTCCGKYSAAIKDTNMVLELAGPSVELLLLRKRLYSQVGLEDLARQQLREAAKLAPRHPEVVSHKMAEWEVAEDLFRKATSCMLIRDYTQAVAHLSHAVKLAPTEIRFLLLRGAAYRALGDLSQSLKDIDAAGAHWGALSDMNATTIIDTQKAPDSMARRHGVRAPSLSSMLEGPAEHDQVAHQRNLTLNAQAVRQAGLGLHRQAIEILTRVIDSERRQHTSDGKPVDPRFLVNRGDAFRMVGEVDLAAADYAAAAKSGGSTPAIAARQSLLEDTRGVQLFNAGKYAEAVDRMTKAISLSGGVAAYHVHRGEAYMQCKDIARAALDFKRALELEPGNRVAQRHLKLFFSR